MIAAVYLTMQVADAGVPAVKNHLTQSFCSWLTKACSLLVVDEGLTRLKGPVQDLVGLIESTACSLPLIALTA